MIRALVLLLLLATPLKAQNFSGLARVLDADATPVDYRFGGEFTLRLSQPVPWRVFTLDEPKRLVVDFREVDWTGFDLTILEQNNAFAAVRAGGLRPGWSRLVIDLTYPIDIAVTEMRINDTDGTASLTIAGDATTNDIFAAGVKNPQDDIWVRDLPPVSLPAPTPDNGPVTVVIDPGHGGLDPGAERGGVNEADLMLQLSIEVADALNRSGVVRAVLTREADIFVPLNQRITIARAAGADLLISLHADALEEDAAKGASVYTLNAAGVDQAAARMAERHERGDLLVGLDFTGTDDRVATVLMDLARSETGPQGDRFAAMLVDAMRNAGQNLNSRPRREGRLAVLNAADFASVLVEVGFLSNDRDRNALLTPQGRAPVVNAILSAVQTWAIDEAARDALIRQ